MLELEVRQSLTAEYYQEIGRIVTHWAFLEWRLKNVAYALLGIGPKHGRIAVVQRDAAQYVSMLRDLLEVSKISPKVNLKELIAVLEFLGEHRNSLVHGIWLKHPDYEEPVLQLTKGSWPPDPKRVKRIIEPEPALMKVDEMRKFVDLIDHAAGIAGQLEIEVKTAIAGKPDLPATPLITSPCADHPDLVGTLFCRRYDTLRVAPLLSSGSPAADRGESRIQLSLLAGARADQLQPWARVEGAHQQVHRHHSAVRGAVSGGAEHLR